MIRFLAGRLLASVPVLFIVSVLTFILIYFVPGDVSAELAGPGASSEDTVSYTHLTLPTKA